MQYLMGLTAFWGTALGCTGACIYALTGRGVPITDAGMILFGLFFTMILARDAKKYKLMIEIERLKRENEELKKEDRE